MAAPTDATEPRRRRPPLPVVTAVILAIVAAGWTAVWATARSRLLGEIDARLTALAAQGVVVACPDRAVGGFPFRMEFSCTAPGVEIRDRAVAASTAAVRVVAQVWDPHLVLIECDGPGLLRQGDTETAAKWRTLRASLRWSTAGVQRLSVAAEDLDAGVRGAGRPAVRFAAAHTEVHGRPSGAAGRDLDLAGDLAAASLDVAGRTIGPPKADVSLATTLADFLPPGPGPALVAFAERGGVADPTSLSLSVGGVALEGKGRLVLDRSGVLDGTVTLLASGLEGLANGGAGRLGPELTTVLSGFVLLGKPSGDPAKPGRRLEMIVDHGRVRIGRATLGDLPPLFPPGS